MVVKRVSSCNCTSLGTEMIDATHRKYSESLDERKNRVLVCKALLLMSQATCRSTFPSLLKSLLFISASEMVQ